MKTNRAIRDFLAGRVLLRPATLRWYRRVLRDDTPLAVLRTLLTRLVACPRITPMTSEPKAILVYLHTCQQCGHRWESPNRVPRQCPHCWSRKWNRASPPPLAKAGSLSPRLPASKEG